jgi:hypothetical protein
VLGIIVAGVLVCSLLLMRRSARRFAEEQKRLGRWDDQGPLVETRGPPHTTRGGEMGERLEVAGLWDPPVVKDRRPKTDEQHPADPDRRK